MSTKMIDELRRKLKERLKEMPDSDLILYINLADVLGDTELADMLEKEFERRMRKNPGVITRLPKYAPIDTMVKESGFFAEDEVFYPDNIVILKKKRNPKRKRIRPVSGGKRKEFFLIGPCPEIILETKVLRFKRPYPLMVCPKDGHELYIFRPFKKEAVDAEVSEEAVERYEIFNNKRARRTFLLKIPDLKGFRKVGKVLGEVYLSDKEHDGVHPYQHMHNEDGKGDYPNLYINRSGTVMLIKGGNLRVEDWLYG